MLSRYKQHCATDALIGHDKAGFNIWNGSYPMRLRHIKSIELYKIKHEKWWYYIHRQYYMFVNDFDRKHFIFSNMQLRKKRRADGYSMKSGKN